VIGPRGGSEKGPEEWYGRMFLRLRWPSYLTDVLAGIFDHGRPDAVMAAWMA
jgi:hypothetical protein